MSNNSFGLVIIIIIFLINASFTKYKVFKKPKKKNKKKINIKLEYSITGKTFNLIKNKIENWGVQIV